MGLRVKILLLGFLGLLFIAGGYLLSDDLFFEKLLLSQHISTPEQANAYLQKQITMSDLNTVNGYTPRFLLTKKRKLYCDEGAIVLATMVHELGFPTRLTDLVVPNSATRHTILEVYENGKWKTYDTVQNLQDLNYHSLIDFYENDAWRTNKFISPGTRVCKDPVNHGHLIVSHRAYPRFWNWLMQHNYFIQKAALYVRGIPS